MKNKIALITLCLLVWGSLVIPIDVQKKSVIILNQKNEILQRPMGFVSVKDERFFVLDYKAKNIKIYDKNGEFVKIWKRQGFGPEEFGKPLLIEYRTPYLFIGDLGKRRIFFYSDKDNNDFVNKKEIISGSIGDDAKIDGNRILIATGKTDKDGRIYVLHLLDFEKEPKYEPLLSVEDKCGFGSFKEYKSKYNSISALLWSGYCDILGDYAYYVWTSNLRIIKINVKSKQKWVFGFQTKNYKKPVQTKKMKELYDSRADNDYIENRPYSFITGIIADPKFVALIYANYSEKLSSWQYFIQFYSHNGTFIEEKELPGAINNDYYPMKCHYYEKNTLYFLFHSIDKDLDDIYSIIKYKIQ